MSQELEQLKNEMSELALQIADSFGVTLDYSTDSIREVESILGEFHNEYKKTGSDQGMRGIAFEFASYIVKAGEKNLGPLRWERDHPEIGEGTFPLYLAEEEVIFPFAWCEKRIFDGPGDDVWTKYSLFVLKRDPPAKKKKGFLQRILGS